MAITATKTKSRTKAIIISLTAITLLGVAAVMFSSKGICGQLWYYHDIYSCDNSKFPNKSGIKIYLSKKALIANNDSLNLDVYVKGKSYSEFSDLTLYYPKGIFVVSYLDYDTPVTKKSGEADTDYPYVPNIYKPYTIKLDDSAKVGRHKLKIVASDFEWGKNLSKTFTIKVPYLNGKPDDETKFKPYLEASLKQDIISVGDSAQVDFFAHDDDKLFDVKLEWEKIDKKSVNGEKTFDCAKKTTECFSSVSFKPKEAGRYKVKITATDQGYNGEKGHYTASVVRYLSVDSITNSIKQIQDGQSLGNVSVDKNIVATSGIVKLSLVPNIASSITKLILSDSSNENVSTAIVEKSCDGKVTVCDKLLSSVSKTKAGKYTYYAYVKDISNNRYFLGSVSVNVGDSTPSGTLEVSYNSKGEQLAIDANITDDNYIAGNVALRYKKDNGDWKEFSEDGGYETQSCDSDRECFLGWEIDLPESNGNYQIEANFKDNMGQSGTASASVVAK
jgi:hypothetical protein